MKVRMGMKEHCKTKHLVDYLTYNKRDGSWAETETECLWCSGSRAKLHQNQKWFWSRNLWHGNISENHLSLDWRWGAQFEIEHLWCCRHARGTGDLHLFRSSINAENEICRFASNMIVSFQERSWKLLCLLSKLVTHWKHLEDKETQIEPQNCWVTEIPY